MKANYIIKRMLAFLFDYITVNFLAGMLLPLTASKYSQQVLDYAESASDDVLANEEFLSLVNKMTEATANDSIFLLVLFIVYYVVIAKLLGGKTLGCHLFKQKIVKTDGSALTNSDLTVRMLFTNLGMVHLIAAVIFTVLASSLSVALILYSILILSYIGFVITNVVFLFVTSTTLVDRMTKSKPLIILGQRKI